MNFTDYLELYSAFKDILFINSNHSYWHNNKRFFSVSALKKGVEPDFDHEYWSYYKAIEATEGVKPIPLREKRKYKIRDKYLTVKQAEKIYDRSNILQEWSAAKKDGLAGGSKIHEYLEHRWSGKIFDEDIPKYVPRVYNELSSRLIPIAIEKIVGDYDFRYAGQFDGLFYSHKDGVILRDTKTDKSIDFDNKYEKLLPPLDFLDSCNFNIYTLQLNLYARCIEKYTKIKVSKLYIDHIPRLPEKVGYEYQEYEVPKIIITDDTVRTLVELAGKSK